MHDARRSSLRRRGRRAPAIVLSLAAALAIAAPAAAQDSDLDDDPEAAAEVIVKVIEQAVKSASSSPSIVGGIDPRHASAEELHIARVIRGTRFDLKIEDREIDVVIEVLRRVSGLNFTVSRKAKESLAEERPKISLELRGLALENVLNLIAMQLGDYRFTLRYGTVMLIRKEEYRPPEVLRVYNITDLIHRPRDFRAPKLGLSGVEEE